MEETAGKDIWNLHNQTNTSNGKIVISLYVLIECTFNGHTPYRLPYG